MDEDGTRSLDQIGSPNAVPSKRRFGGPFVPIPGLATMTAQAKCIALERTMQNILSAWRLAKQGIKDLDPRSSKAKRVRAIQKLPQAIASVPPTPIPVPASTVNSPLL
ncbi:At rich interactive domain [Cichlidogyrus casuarinus]|uniref:At rich interactive domain n=1 Tax=Cichlidogyrus casuarinus TaxID=1844966 RepID=A0ABD2QGG5_9PLAT